MFDMQAMIDAMGESNKRTRSKYHLTLGELMDTLKTNPQAYVITDTGAYIGSPHSYRGYYSDLSFEALEDKKLTGQELWNQLNDEVLNKELEGYKGGEFMMSADVPCWFANYGRTGRAMIDASVIDGNIVIETQEDED